VSLIWLVLDQATKALAVEGLAGGRVVDVWALDLNLVRNPGGAFSLPGFPGMFILVTVVVLAIIVRALPRTDRLGLVVAYGLISGGALGNLTDRLLRFPGFPDGSVVDFLDLGWWPVFNVADVGIVCGAAAIVALVAMAEREDRAFARAAAHQPSVRPETTVPRGPVTGPDKAAGGSGRSASADGEIPAAGREEGPARGTASSAGR
jgi:signal peptidase II